MSLESFIANLWNAAQSLFGKFPKSLKIAVHIGVDITENIKRFIDSPLADVLTAIIPGEIDDRIKAILRDQIPKILTALKLADQCGETTDPQQAIKCAIQTLQNLESEIKSAFLHNLSVRITQLISDGELSWSDGVCIVEWYYKHKYKKAI